MKQHLIPFTVPAIGAVMIVAWGAVSAPAAAPAAQQRQQCFLASNVNGFNSHGDEAVDVHVGASRYYRLSLIGACPDVDWSSRIAIRTRGGGSWICEGGDAEIIAPSPTGQQSCVVSNVRALTPAEVAESRQHH